MPQPYTDSTRQAGTACAPAALVAAGHRALRRRRVAHQPGVGGHPGLHRRAGDDRLSRRHPPRPADVLGAQQEPGRDRTVASLVAASRAARRRRTGRRPDPADGAPVHRGARVIGLHGSDRHRRRAHSGAREHRAQRVVAVLGGLGRLDRPRRLDGAARGRDGLDARPEVVAKRAAVAAPRRLRRRGRHHCGVQRADRRRAVHLRDRAGLDRHGHLRAAARVRRRLQCLDARADRLRRALPDAAVPGDRRSRAVAVPRPGRGRRHGRTAVPGFPRQRQARFRPHRLAARAADGHRRADRRRHFRVRPRGLGERLQRRQFAAAPRLAVAGRADPAAREGRCHRGDDGLRGGGRHLHADAVLRRRARDCCSARPRTPRGPR